MNKDMLTNRSWFKQCTAMKIGQTRQRCIEKMTTIFHKVVQQNITGVVEPSIITLPQIHCYMLPAK